MKIFLSVDIYVIGKVLTVGLQCQSVVAMTDGDCVSPVLCCVQTPSAQPANI